MENDDTDIGGESLSIEQAASAFVKATSDGANSQPDEEVEQSEEAEDELQASGEDEGESEGEDDPESQADDEDDEEPDSDHGRFVASNGKVKLPDGTVSTIADLIAGNMKERDYRQKTMELAPQRRAIEEQSSALQASERQVNENREYLARLMESLTPQPPDPNLMQTDIIGYMEAKERHERFMAHANQIHQQMGLSRQQAEEKVAGSRQELKNREWGILQDKIPALRDEAKLRSFVADVETAATTVGYSLQEITDFVPYDHRAFLILQKAAKWDRLQASKPKAAEKSQGRPPVQRSGKQLSGSAKQAQRSNDAVNRLRQTGTVEDAARAYLASRKG